jgi:hypothetical protein
VSAVRLLADLRTRGIQLERLDGGLIRYCAPRGVMTVELMEQVRVHRAELLEALVESPTSTSPAETKSRAARRRFIAECLLSVVRDRGLLVQIMPSGGLGVNGMETVPAALIDGLRRAVNEYRSELTALGAISNSCRVDP